MSAWLAARASATPERVALVEDGRALSYAALEARVGPLAARLGEAGVRAGDRVAALLWNGSPLVALFHATLRLGAVFQPLNLRLTPDELSFQLGDAGPRLLLHGGGALGATAEAAAASSGTACLALGEAERVAVFSRPTPPAPGDSDPDRVVALLYTSGTTGRPRGALLVAGAFEWNAAATALHLGASPDDRWLACLPLFHVGGLALLARATLTGAAVVVHPRFDAAAVSGALDRDGITHVSLVPTMLSRLLVARGGRPAPHGLRCVLLGGAAVAPALLDAALDAGWPLAPSYGLTEATSQVATQTPEETRRRRSVGGRPLPGLRIRIEDDAGMALPPGRVGEICVRGPTLMAGYLGLSGDTARALRGGWLHTGDAGRLDPEGRLEVLDRRSDLVVSGGENVYPAEVEAALLAHPAVLEAAVAGEPDPELGHRVVAAVVLRPGLAEGAADEEALRAFCRRRLAGFKVPRRIVATEALPRTGSGKVLRRAVPEQLFGAAGGAHENA